jgi:hypothetical protein
MKRIAVVVLALLALTSLVVTVGRPSDGEPGEGEQEHLGEPSKYRPVYPGTEVPCDFEGKTFCVSATGDVYYDPSDENTAYHMKLCRVNEERGNPVPLVCQGLDKIVRIVKMQF